MEFAPTFRATQEELSVSRRPSRLLFPLACLAAPSFRPSRHSHHGPAGLASVRFGSLTVSPLSRFLASPWIRGQDPRVLCGKLKNPWAVRFITKPLICWSLSVAPPTCVSPGLSYRTRWPRTLSPPQSAGCRVFAVVFPLVAIPGCPSASGSLWPAF